MVAVVERVVHEASMPPNVSVAMATAAGTISRR